jgi:hypothetical protein
MRAVNQKVLSLPRRLVLRIQSRIHSKEGRQFALLLARLNIPIIAINAITQILVPPPKYMVDQLVPTAHYSDTGRVRRIFIIGRGPEGEEPLPYDEAVSTLLANTEDAYGFPPFSIMERAITLRSRNLRKGKKQDISLLRARERAILGDFLSNMSVCRLISPNFGWADVIPERVLQPAVRGASEDPRSATRQDQSAGAINGAASAAVGDQARLSEDDVEEPSDVSSSAA